MILPPKCSLNWEKKKFLPGETAGERPEDARGGGARGQQRRPSARSSGADAEARLTWTALRWLFILNPYRVGVNSSNFIPAPDNVIVLLVTNRQRAAGDKAGL